MRSGPNKKKRRAANKKPASRQSRHSEHKSQKGGPQKRKPAPRDKQSVSNVIMDQGPLVLTGRHTCEAVLRYQPRRVSHIWLLEGAKGLDIHLKLAQGTRRPISFVDRAELDAMAPEMSHQGIVLTVEEFPLHDMEELPRSDMPLWVGLDGIQDPRNLGAAARACYAFGADGICIPKNRAAQVTPLAEKIAVGCLARLPVAQVTNLRRAMDYARKEGFWIVGAEANGEADPWEVDMNQPLFLMVGGEDSGLRRLTRENCDQIVRLPTPRAVSLNAADALAVFLYEMNRQRKISE